MNKTQKKIFDSAIKVFSLSGYDGATMDRVAEVAGVAKGTLYYNFKNKEKLLNEIIKYGIEFLIDELKEISSKYSGPVEKLKEICKFQLTFFYQNKDLVKVVLSQLWGTEKRQYELREMIKDYIKYIRIIIEEAIEKEYIKKGDSLILAHIFFGSIVSTSIYDLINSDTGDLDEIINSTIKFIINGLGIQK